MVQSLRSRDQKEGGNGKKQKWLAVSIGCFEKSTQKQSVKQCKYKQVPGQKKRIGIHHGVLGIRGRIGQYCHAEECQYHRDRKAEHLDQQGKTVFCFYHIGLFDGEQDGV